MNNRQGMNSRLPYNPRAFSPQRMNESFSNNSHQAFPTASSNYNQQGSYGGSSSNSYGQPFDQYQRSSTNTGGQYSNSVNSGQNQGRDSINIWNNYGGRSNMNSQEGAGSYSGYDSSNRNQGSSNYNNQPSNNRSSTNQIFDLFSSLNSQFDDSHRNLSSSHGYNANNHNSSRNQTSSSRSNDRGNQDRNRNNNRGQSTYGSNSANKTKSKKSAESHSTKPQKPRKEPEVFPDIGNPTITPKIGQMFTLQKILGKGLKVYKCLVCKILDLNEKSIPSHQTGKKHKYHLKKIEDTLSGTTKAEKEKQFAIFMKNRSVVEGTHKPQFEDVIKDVETPLVGLDYTIEVLDKNAKEPVYTCVLCKKSADPRTIINHLISQNHRINYLTRHFPQVIEILNDDSRFKDDVEFRQKALIKVTSKIEKNFGRGVAFVYEGSDFNQTKLDIFESIESKQHKSFDDFSGGLAVLLHAIPVDTPKWEKPKEKLEQVDASEILDGVKRKRKIPVNVIAEYHLAVEAAKKELNEKFEGHEKDPESHPYYKEEWEKFWKRKVEEMEKRGEDPKGRSFHKEWCEYFLNRIQELHKDEVKWRLGQIRRNLGLSVEDVEGEIVDQGNEQTDKEDEPFKDRKGRFHIIENDDDDDSSFDEDYREFGPRIPKEVLYEKEKKIFDQFLDKMRSCPIKIDDSSTSLVATCRILSNLETELGLLAQKVLDLLSKSLAYEREHSKSADEMLFESDNLNLVETVKEKLIGMRQANLVDKNRKQAVEIAINDLSKLIEQHEVMVNIKKTLREMGKDEASPEEIKMLKSMFMKKKDDQNVKTDRKVGPSKRAEVKGSKKWN